MSVREETHEQLLRALNATIVEAAAFLATASPILPDGRMTAHGLLAQMVFWHERYIEIARALIKGQGPELRSGSLEALNAAARQRYAREPMVMLAHQLTALQQELDHLLRVVPDWSANFPIKRDSEFCSVEERVRQIEENIRNRVMVLRRALRP